MSYEMRILSGKIMHVVSIYCPSDLPCIRHRPVTVTLIAQRTWLSLAAELVWMKICEGFGGRKGGRGGLKVPVAHGRG